MLMDVKIIRVQYNKTVIVLLLYSYTFFFLFTGTKPGLNSVQLESKSTPKLDLTLV